MDNITAQKASFTSPGGLSIGFGSGASYQTSDIANSMGFGADFIFGSNTLPKRKCLLSVDWKFRFLAGLNKAYDHRINADDTYSNIRYNFFTYDLEVGLTLNRLRERTRIILSAVLPVWGSPMDALSPISTMPATICTTIAASIQTATPNRYTMTWCTQRQGFETRPLTKQPFFPLQACI